MVGLRDRFDNQAAGRKRSRNTLGLVRINTAAEAAVNILGFYGATEVAPLQSQIAFFVLGMRFVARLKAAPVQSHVAPFSRLM
jgi:hypothetical protein